MAVLSGTSQLRPYMGQLYDGHNCEVVFFLRLPNIENEFLVVPGTSLYSEMVLILRCSQSEVTLNIVFIGAYRLEPCCCGLPVSVRRRDSGCSTVTPPYNLQI